MLIGGLVAGAKYRYDHPSKWEKLVTPFLKELDAIDQVLGPFDTKPLIWTADFILGPKSESGEDTYILGEINASCVGFTSQLELAPLVARSIRDMTIDVKGGRRCEPAPHTHTHSTCALNSESEERLKIFCVFFLRAMSPGGACGRLESFLSLRTETMAVPHPLVRRWHEEIYSVEQLK